MFNSPGTSFCQSDDVVAFKCDWNRLPLDLRWCFPLEILTSFTQNIDKALNNKKNVVNHVVAITNCKLTKSFHATAVSSTSSNIPFSSVFSLSSSSLPLPAAACWPSKSLKFSGSESDIVFVEIISSERKSRGKQLRRR